MIVACTLVGFGHLVLYQIFEAFLLCFVCFAVFEVGFTCAFFVFNCFLYRWVPPPSLFPSFSLDGRKSYEFLFFSCNNSFRFLPPCSRILNFWIDLPKLIWLCHRYVTSPDDCGKTFLEKRFWKNVLQCIILWPQQSP